MPAARRQAGAGGEWRKNMLYQGPTGREPGNFAGGGAHGLYRHDRGAGKGHSGDAGGAGRDCQAPTGTGKTCAFGIPIIERMDRSRKTPQAVILAPTRELAQQIAEDLEDLCHFLPEVRIACVYGGANMQKADRPAQAGCQIVVATPGRLMDHMQHRN